MTPRFARLVATAAVVTAFLSLTQRASADYILDGFTNPTPGQTYQIDLPQKGVTTFTSPSVGVSSGVTRDVTVTVVSPIPPSFNSASGTLGGGAFSMDTDNATAATSTIKFTLLGAARDLTGTTALDLDFLNFNPGNTATGVALTAPVSISIATSGGTLTRTATINGGAVPFTASFALASFSGSGNLGQVNSITFVLNGGTAPQKAVDFALDDVRVKGSMTAPPVPAPPAVLLAGFGVLAFVGRARWVRKPTATA